MVHQNHPIKEHVFYCVRISNFSATAFFTNRQLNTGESCAEWGLICGIMLLRSPPPFYGQSQFRDKSVRERDVIQPYPLN